MISISTRAGRALPSAGACLGDIEGWLTSNSIKDAPTRCQLPRRGRARRFLVYRESDQDARAPPPCPLLDGRDGERSAPTPRREPFHGALGRRRPLHLGRGDHLRLRRRGRASRRDRRPGGGVGPQRRTRRPGSSRRRRFVSRPEGPLRPRGRAGLREQRQLRRRRGKRVARDAPRRPAAGNGLVPELQRRGRPEPGAAPRRQPRLSPRRLRLPRRAGPRPRREPAPMESRYRPRARSGRVSGESSPPTSSAWAPSSG